MANPTITNINIGRVALWNNSYQNETLQFAGADTWVEGTILARKVVSDTVTVTPDGGNTGDGTVTAAPTASRHVPLVGGYVLTCTAAVTNGGVFKLVDPNGGTVATGLTLTAGAGASTTFEVDGLSIVVTDGATDFAAGDIFTLAVAADGDLVPYAIAGAGGAQVPIAVLPYEVVTTGAGDIAGKVIVGGQVDRGLLVIDADGDNSNLTSTIEDQLRSAGILVVAVNEIGELDNQ